MASGLPNGMGFNPLNYQTESDEEDLSQGNSPSSSISQSVFTSSDLEVPSLEGRVSGRSSRSQSEELGEILASWESGSSDAESARIFEFLFSGTNEITPGQSPLNPSVEISERDQLELLLSSWNPGCSEEEKAEIEDVLISCFEQQDDSLIIHSDNITSLPDIFFLSGYQNVKTLCLTCNDLTELPASVEHLTALELFALTNCNSISTLPDCITHSTTLKEIEIEGCEEAESLLESLVNLPALEELNIHDCESLESLEINFSGMTALRKLDICDCESLASLSANMGDATNLREIEIANCQSLQSLPNSIGNLANLTTLRINNCKSLAALPENLSGLIALETLHLADCESIEYIPESIGDCRALTWVEFEHTAIETLPESIGNLLSLRTLGLDGTYSLRRLPDSIGNLDELETIQLFSSALRRIPRTVGNLQRLRQLDLRDAGSILEIPRELYNLSNQCEILFDDGGIPISLSTAIVAVIQAEGYSGPRFSLPLLPSPLRFPHNSLEEVIDLMFTRATLQSERLSNFLSLEDSERDEIKGWLHRMHETKDSHSPFKVTYYKSIVGYLKLANENTRFRELFLQVLRGAAETCGDRISLSVLHLGIAARKTTCDKTDLKAYAELLKGLLALDLLEEIARQKIEMLRSRAAPIDEVEVFLGYPVRLKEVLNLPIDVQDMLYFRCSDITERDLEIARDFVLAQIGHEEGFLTKLVKNDDWVDALKAQYPEEYAVIEEEKYAALEAEEEALDAGARPCRSQIVDNYIQALIELSKKALA